MSVPSKKKLRHLFGRLDSLRDADFEVIYQHAAQVIADPGSTTVLDFRRITWFDLWSLIQILFLLSDVREQGKRVLLWLRSPEALPSVMANSSGQDRLRAAHRFLVDIGFLHHVDRLGVEVWLQGTSTEGRSERVGATKFGSVFASSTTPPDERRILPITQLTDLNLLEKRDELFRRAPEIFGHFHTEAIVQEAGLGDCLLQELVTNALEHGSHDGYVALRAVKGLRRFVHRDPKKYRQAKHRRKDSHVGDWEYYFQHYPDDAYFELVVADRGRGIARSIQEDPRRPDYLKKQPESSSDIHALLRYSLRDDSSRFSSEERQRMDRTEFTGLGAVVFVLNSHQGFLLIREHNSRHVFSPIGGWKGLGFDTHRKTGQRLSAVSGVSVTAVVPMRRTYHQRPPYETLVTEESGDGAKEVDCDNMSVFRVRRAYQSRVRSTLDKVSGKSWDSIAQEIRSLSTGCGGILIDVGAASIDKNELWTGLTRVYRNCREKAVPLILAGLELRHVRRLEEYAELDRKRISGGMDWVLLGFGDNAAVYCLGNVNGRPPHSDIGAALATSFRTGRSLDQRVVAVAKGGEYVSWREEETTKATRARLVSSVVAAREALRRQQSAILEKEINESESLVRDSVVALTDGEKVRDYICIHSLIQMRELYSDLSRLVYLLACAFHFDYVLAVGSGCRQAVFAVQRELGERGRQLGVTHSRWYTYHDYYSLRHGEGPGLGIPEDARVLIIVDGIRKGKHAHEVVCHVRDNSAVPVGIVSLLALSGDAVMRQVDGVSVVYALRVPIRPAPPEAGAIYCESPFSQTITRVREQSRRDRWEVLLTKGQAYRHVDGFGLVMRGHRTFYEQHFARTVSLPYLLSSSTTLSAELIDAVKRIIKEEHIDTIVYPDQSSIGLLVDRIVYHVPRRRRLSTIMCRRATWPDSGHGYDLDLVGRKSLKNARRILIIEDETFTGSSVKDLVTLCLTEVSRGPKALVVFVIIDSMKRSERASLSAVLCRKGGPKTRLVSFMRLSLCTYWNEASCPLCRRSRDIERELLHKPGFIERDYARRRCDELAPTTMDQDYWKRPEVTRLHQERLWRGTFDQADVALNSEESLELFCEEAYVEGDLSWLVNRLCPSHMQFFAEPEVLLAVIDLLSRDLDLLLQLNLRDRFFSYLRAIFVRGDLAGSDLSRLMEIVAGWPLRCLCEVWGWLLNDMLRPEKNKLPDAYPGAVFLLSQIDKRASHPSKKRLQEEFDTLITGMEDVNPRQPQSASRYYLVRCLRRGAYSERSEYKGLAALISEISFILGYSAKESHKTFLKGLDLLAKSSRTADSRQLIYVVQLASLLSHALDSAASVDPESRVLLRHTCFSELQRRIAVLQERFPRTQFLGEDTKRHDAVTDCAARIMTILYDDPGEGSFRRCIETYLDAYTTRVSDVVSWASTWAAKDEGVQFSTVPQPMSDNFDDVQLVLSSASFKEVFKVNLERNLDAALANWKTQHDPSLIYQGPRFQFRLEMKPSVMGIVQARILNSCSDKDRENLVKGVRGTGFARISTDLERMGYSFLAGYNEASRMCEQLLSARRMHR